MGHEGMMKTSDSMIAVMKVTKGCNARCRYCYMDLTPTFRAHDVMALEVVEAVVASFGRRFDRITYSWHGGEPTLAGMKFFEDALQIQRRHCESRSTRKRFKNTVQTNGLTFNEEWLSFFRARGFGLGFSLDGPSGLAPFRVDTGGNPTAERVAAILSELRDRHSYRAGVICVVTSKTAQAATELYDWFKSIGVGSLSILPYLGQDEGLRLTTDDYLTFYAGMFDRWIEDPSGDIDTIFPFAQITSNLLSMDKTVCSWDGSCFRGLLAIEPAGDVSLCCALHSAEHIIGNVLHDDIDAMLSSTNYLRALEAQDSVLRQCAECDVFSVCNGGCREASYYTYGELNRPDPLCIGRRNLILHIIRKLKTKACAYARKEEPGCQTSLS